MALQKNLPRGIRNNNPLNIRIGNVWLGEVREPTDHQFEQFISMEMGIRAGFVILRRYLNRYHRNTVSLIIKSWAPSSENNTSAYIKTVCSLTGLLPDAPLTFTDKTTMVDIVDAMIRVECGQSVPRSKIEKGYDMS